MIKTLIIIFLTLMSSSSVHSTNEEAKTERDIFKQEDVLYYSTIPDENGMSDSELFIEDIDYSIMSTSTEQPSPDEQDIYVENSDFMYNYFAHLSSNKLTNIIGVCGYTGIGMLLSYYDTYWDDNFIPEKYDSAVSYISSSELYSTTSYESPGIYDTLSSSKSINTLKNEIKALGITDENSIEFKEALDAKIMEFIIHEIEIDSFAGRLFDIALENGSIIPHYTIDTYYSAPEGGNNVLSNEYLQGIGVQNSVMNAVLGDYVEQNEYINGKVYIRTSKLGNHSDEEKARIRNEIIELVKEGKPVLMGGNGYKDKNNNGIQDMYNQLEDGTYPEGHESEYGHVVVAYDYDEENDILYGNMGWGESQNHHNLDEYFNIQMSDYWTFDIYDSLPQTYTDNYYFTDKNMYFAPYQNGLFNTLVPEEYGFAESYYTEETHSYIQLPSSNNQITVSFNRFRCGYINEQAINISPRNIGCNEAYVEYTFNKHIDKIFVDLSFWSSNELVNNANSEYKIQYFENGVWVTAVDLWADIVLPNNRNHPLTVEANFPSEIFKFRIYSSSIFTSDSNKGCLSIFDMKIFYSACTYSYEPYSTTQHKAKCKCGKFILQGHVIKNGQNKCLVCGATVDMGFIVMNINSLSISSITSNGSYILPNGVIVLDEKDVEAFLNGTLIFENCNCEAV